MSSEVSEKFLLLLSDWIVLIAGCLWYLVEPTNVQLIAKERHPRSWDSTFKYCLPINSSEPLMILY